MEKMQGIIWKTKQEILDKIRQTLLYCLQSMRKNAKGAEEKKRSQETKKMEFMETKFNENDEKESL